MLVSPKLGYVYHWPLIKHGNRTFLAPGMHRSAKGKQICDNLHCNT